MTSQNSAKSRTCPSWHWPRVRLSRARCQLFFEIPRRKDDLTIIKDLDFPTATGVDNHIRKSVKPALLILVHLVDCTRKLDLVCSVKFRGSVIGRERTEAQSVGLETGWTSKEPETVWRLLISLNQKHVPLW